MPSIPSIPSILLWTPESDNDSLAVKCLAEKIVRHCGSSWIIKISSKQAYIGAVQKDTKNGLKIAVDIYLKEYDLVIFLIDADGVQSQHQRRNQPNSYINQITKIINDQNIFLLEIKQELEAWLLVDCLGICCYYTKQDNPRYDADWIKFSQKHQKGDTQSIIEAESGGKGAKEHLEKFSDEINLKINPNLAQKPKNLKDKRYQESDSPEIANHILIENQTLKRNQSLWAFSEYFKIKEE